MAGNLTDRQAVDAYVDGDRAAFTEVDRHINAAMRTFRDRLGDEDRFIRADIHDKVYRSLADGKFGFRAGLATYINRIACHTCIDYLRFIGRFDPNDIADLNRVGNEPTPEANLDRKQLGRLVFRVVRRLPRKCLELWKMQLQEDLNYREIGMRINESEEYARRRAWECREKAKEVRKRILEKDKRL